jgi:hypothetical protein
MDQCAACHQPFGGTGIPGEPENPDFSPNRFVLTGSVEGDLNVAISMVTNVCVPQNSYLLLYPASGALGTPVHPLVDGAPVLTPGDPDYEAIRTWIASGACGT